MTVNQRNREEVGSSRYEQIIDKTDGIPLFVEELTKMVLEFGLLVEDIGRYRLDSPLPPLAIPATLQDLRWRGSTGWRQSRRWHR